GATTIANAASIDHIMNYTPEYNANPALQGAINTSSTVNYNPAGLVRLENGVYVNGGLQLAVGEQKMTYNGYNHDSDLLSVVPNFSIVKKQDKKAYFVTMGGIAGGAGLKYEKGLAAYQKLAHKYGVVLDNNGTAEGENRYLQTTLGTSFELNEKLSMSLAGRIVQGQRNFKGDLSGKAYGIIPVTASVDVDREAWGAGFQLGFNYAATEKLNLGLRYDSKVKLNFETKANKTEDLFNSKYSFLPEIGFSTLYPEYRDGRKARRDLPAILALGSSYEVSDVWTVFAGGNYYFNKAANIGEEVQTKIGASKKYKDGYELSIGSEYQVNEKWAWLAGLNYAYTGAKQENYHDSEYSIDSVMLGTGVKYSYSKNLMLTGSVAHYFYLEDSANDITYNKSITALGLGFTYKWN
ncbi:MAG: OmpP1/FadL family transporter, partial [Cetobacterium sp.]